MQFVDFHPHLKLAYTEVKDGNVDDRFGLPSEVKKNRKQILKDFQVPSYNLIEAQQIHFTRILPLYEENTKMWRGQKVTGIDGYVNEEIGSALMLRVADCVPIVLYDQEHHTNALLHGGWRGVKGGIHLDALEMMVTRYETDPKQVLVWLGPSAADQYLIDQVPEQKDDPDWKPFIKKKKDGWLVDLPGYITQTLNAAGVFKKNITQSPEVTVTSKDLFSHQRSLAKKQPEGRFAVLMQMLPNPKAKPIPKPEVV